LFSASADDIGFFPFRPVVCGLCSIITRMADPETEFTDEFVKIGRDSSLLLIQLRLVSSLLKRALNWDERIPTIYFPGVLKSIL
jgi:hypothetical protein